MCVKVDGGEGGGIEGAAHGARQAAMEAQVAGAHPGGLPHALFNGRALGFDATRGEGQCRLCLHKHASGACKTCSIGLDTDRAKPFCVCYPCRHGRQCYRQHLHIVLGMRARPWRLKGKSRNCGSDFSIPPGTSVVNRWHAINRRNRQPQTASRAYEARGAALRVQKADVSCIPAWRGGSQRRLVATRVQQGVKRWGGASVS